MGWLTYESRSGIVWQRMHRRVGDLLAWLAKSRGHPVVVVREGEQFPDEPGRIERVTRNGSSSPVFTRAAWESLGIDPAPKLRTWVLEEQPPSVDGPQRDDLRWVGPDGGSQDPPQADSREHPFAALVERLAPEHRAACPAYTLGGGLPLRAQRFLGGFDRIADLADLRGQDLEAVPNFGARSRLAIEDALRGLAGDDGAALARGPSPIPGVPAALAAVDVAVLGVTRKMYDRLRRAGVETCGDLDGLRVVAPSVRDACGALITAFQRAGVTADATPGAVLDGLLPDGLVADLERRMQRLDERGRDILRQRTLAKQPRTLAMLAQTYGISRERIRQLEKRFVHVSLRAPALAPLIDAELDRLRAGRAGPLTVTQLAANTAWAQGLAAAPHVLRAYLAASGARHGIVPEGDDARGSGDEPTWLVLPRTCPAWPTLVREILSQPEPSADPQVWARRAAAAAETHGVPELTAWLTERAEARGRRGHAALPAHLPAVEALRRAGGPLTLRELRRRIPGAREYTTANLRGHLAAAGMLLAGPSTYVHPDACQPWAERQAAIREIALDLMRLSPARSWRAWELIEWLEAADEADATELPTWVVDHALSLRPETFERLKRWRWCLVEAPPEARRGLMQVARDVLREAGTPLPNRTLRREVERAYPVRGPVPMRWPIARIGRGVVGLLDRDAGLDKATYKRICTAARKQAAEGSLGLTRLERLLELTPPDCQALGPTFLGRLLVEHDIVPYKDVDENAHRLPPAAVAG